MKLGTDAVLLGAWVDGTLAHSILDIGTGCGIIALLLAQRFSAQITAIEIDEGSVKDAFTNFSKSPWKERLSVDQSRLQDFADNSMHKFDLIVCNPPFFTNSLKSPYPHKNISKHDQYLNHVDLVRCSSSLLAEGGLFGVVLPYQSLKEFHAIANNNLLYLKRQLNIIPVPGKKENRVLLEYTNHECQANNPEVLILHNGDHQPTAEYIELTKEFYLNF